MHQGKWRTSALLCALLCLDGMFKATCHNKMKTIFTCQSQL